jgi:tRNA modification GTPase
MHPFLEDTIAAIATPIGVGAISIIRISGNKAIDAADAIYRGKMRVNEMASHTVHYGKILSDDGEFVDDVLITVFRNPHSYTGEDVVEISSHGNPLISQKIVDRLLKNDVRIAEPGEFTKRAFLNNRIDLSQAEAVIDIISSRSDASLKGARNQLDGLLSKSVSNLRNSLLDTISFVELELDFAEEDIEFVLKEELLEKIDSIIKKIDDLLSTYKFGRVIRDGVNVAIVGKPNVGKSSLLNYLLKESRAIVSDIPGTTRDVIREELSIDGILFKLFDTAGIRLSEDVIEIEGVRRSNEAIKNADIVLLIDDVERGFSEDLYMALLDLSQKDRIIKITNKIDLGTKNTKQGSIEISVLSGQGIDYLLDTMKKTVLGSDIYSEKSAIISNIRHFQCLNSAKISLTNAISTINQRFTGEYVALDLRAATDHLGEIIGEVTSDDVLTNIFSKFCIGK